MNIYGHTSFVGQTGYAAHARGFFRALNNYLPVKLRNFSVGPSWDGVSDRPHEKETYLTDIDKEMFIRQTCDEGMDSGVYKGIDFEMYNGVGTLPPENPVNIILSETNHHYWFENSYPGYNIGYNVWESTLYPNEFFEALLRNEMLWVPTKWQRDCSIAQGYPADRVFVVPEAVDTSIFNVSSGKRPDEFKDDRYKFVLFGRWDHRKSTTEILRAFSEEFGANEPIDLVCSIENPHSVDGMNSTKERLAFHKIEHPNIKIIPFLPRKDYINYLKYGDCFVSCARSEGWNLPLIEAIASGIPTICSSHPAQLDFAGGISQQVRTIDQRPMKPFMFATEGVGLWDEPDFDHLKEIMRSTYENRNINKGQALLKAPRVNKFSWQNAALTAVDILNNNVNENYYKDFGNYITAIKSNNTPLIKINGPIKKQYTVEFLEDNKEVYKAELSNEDSWASSFPISKDTKIRINGEDQFLLDKVSNKIQSTAAKLGAYVVGGDLKYMPYVEACVKSLLEFSKLPIIVYGFNCEVPFSYSRVINKKIEYSGGKVNQVGHVDSQNYFARIAAALETTKNDEFDYYIFLDGDMVVSENIDHLNTYVDKLKHYPLCMRYRYPSLLHFREDGDGRREKKHGEELCELYGWDTGNLPYSGHTVATGIFMYDKRSQRFFEEVLREEAYIRNISNTDSDGKIFVDDTACSEERIINMLFWKYKYDEFLPITWISPHDNVMGFSQGHIASLNYSSMFFMENWPKEMDEIYPKSEANILAYHPEIDNKNPNTASKVLRFLKKIKKEIVVISSYTDTASKEKLLKERIAQIKGFGYDILLSTHYDVPQEIKDEVDHYVYDPNNEIFETPEFFWGDLSGVYFETFYSKNKNHSYAAFTLFKNAFNYCKNLEVDTIHFLNYDVLLKYNPFIKFRTLLKTTNSSGCFITSQSNEDNITFENVRVLMFSVTTKFKGFEGIDSLQEYLELSERQLEKWLYERFRMQNIWDDIIKLDEKTEASQYTIKDSISLTTYKVNLFEKNKNLLALIFRERLDDNEVLFKYTCYEDTRDVLEREAHIKFETDSKVVVINLGNLKDVKNISLLDSHNGVEITKELDEKTLSEIENNIIRLEKEVEMVDLTRNDILQAIEDNKPLKEVVAILAYTNTKEKIDVLKKCIKRIKEFGYDILLVTHYPVSLEIQKSVEHYVYDSNNEIIEIPVTFWFDNEDYFVKSVNHETPNHSYAVFSLFKNAEVYCKSRDIDIIHFLNYDMIPQKDLFKIHKEDLGKGAHGSFYYYDTDEDSFAMTFFSISKNFTAFNNINNSQQYFKASSSRDGDSRLYLEPWIYDLIIKTEGESNLKIRKYIDVEKDYGVKNLITDGALNIYGFVYKKEFRLVLGKPNITDDSKYLLKYNGKEINLDFSGSKFFHHNLGLSSKLNKYQIYKDGKLFKNELVTKDYKKRIEKYNTFVVKADTKLPNKLMIVAHPDDELIFGGYDLLKDPEDWKVISVTGKSNPIRAYEFSKAMETLGVGEYALWDFPDSLYDKFDEKYLRKFILGETSRRYYKKIVTHNSNGEYGHVQHKSLHDAMIEISPRNLYTFSIGDKTKIYPLEEKRKLLEVYESEETELPGYLDYLYYGESTSILNGNISVDHNFVDGPFVELWGSESDHTYDIKFIDQDLEEVVYEKIGVSANSWIKASRVYFTNYMITVHKGEELVNQYAFNCDNKRVLIALDSSSLGDTLAWIPYVQKFKEKHNCEVIVSTFHNHLLDYPELKFISPGTTVDNLYASYVVGIREDDDFLHKRNPFSIPLQEVACDILGLEYEELLPQMAKIKGHTDIDGPYVCLAAHSTAQCKYWNYPGGWQTVVDYLNSKGYKVVVISKEESELNGIIDKTNLNLTETMRILKHATFFMGLSSGLAWLAWALKVPVLMISGFTAPWYEFKCVRMHKDTVCHNCFNEEKFDRGDWNWCPRGKNFECSSSILPEEVINTIYENWNI